MRAVILGGTGAIGGATASRLAAAGWSVDVTGRDPSAMPSELTDSGVRFHHVDRGDTAAIGRLVDDGADLLVDLVAFRGADVRALLPVMSSVVCPVVVSSRAVYVDPDGRHVNGDQPPRFPGPIAEDDPTVAPAGDDVDPFSRAGYAPSKVAVEREALDSGLPVTVLRPSKVHGRWARNPRTRSFVERMVRRDPVIRLADADSVDHLTAAANTAALIDAVAQRPGARVLNSADPDTPTAEQIVRAIGERLGWTGSLEVLDAQADPADGAHPWRSPHPFVLDTSASQRLGYRPQGLALGLLSQEVDWVAGYGKGPRST
jgi:nucleoside-diphosphate-sugar epimerase